MPRWTFYMGSRALFEGQASSEDNAKTQARNRIEKSPWEGSLFPEEIGSLYLGGHEIFLGTVEEFMGKTALKKMGLV